MKNEPLVSFSSLFRSERK